MEDPVDGWSVRSYSPQNAAVSSRPAIRAYCVACCSGKLGADDEAKEFYAELTQAPGVWSTTVGPISRRPTSTGPAILPGGHAPGMRQYRGSSVLQEGVKPRRGHGLGSRAQDPATGEVLGTVHDVSPKHMMGVMLTAWRLGSYYRTYPAYRRRGKAVADPDCSGGRGAVGADRHRRRTGVRGPARQLSPARGPVTYLFAKRFRASLLEAR